MIIYTKQATHYNYFVFSLLGSDYVTDLIKKSGIAFTGIYNFI